MPVVIIFDSQFDWFIGKTAAKGGSVTISTDRNRALRGPASRCIYSTFFVHSCRCITRLALARSILWNCFLQRAWWCFYLRGRLLLDLLARYSAGRAPSCSALARCLLCCGSLCSRARRYPRPAEQTISAICCWPTR